MDTASTVSLSRIGLITPVCGWIAGLVIGLSYTYKLPAWARASTEITFRSLEIPAYFRWLFGYRPRTGPVPVVGFAWQMSAFISLLMNVAFALIAPTWHYAPIVVMLIFFALLRPMLGLGNRIWLAQQ